ncbi:MAG TPA: hypothetical protein PKW06_12560 [Cyclobacteriaceae bacterium]|nr:hypothetical protein [Cyclobacteriaceae bacterium]
MTETQKRVLSATEKGIQPVMDDVDAFFSTDWPVFKKAVSDSHFSLFTN